ncbi:MAG: DUF262 domain-containing HNH endonuclease family protein [bacterium]
MNSKKIGDFFNGRRFFEIPKYQRGFAWEKRNIRELFDDIKEAIDTTSNHYIGTLVLSKKQNKDEHFYIVDGQQRIITITLIINALLEYLSESDVSFYRRLYIKEDKTFRLKMLGKDDNYFINLLNEIINEPENKSQRLLKEAYEEIQLIIKDVGDKKGFLDSVGNLEMMEFIEESEGDAIRIFQTVNDRGKLLSNMEKAKSLLIYFSNKYLEKRLDDKVNEIFGEIFEIYDDIKHIGETVGITLIKNMDFNEDDIMRYHFISFSDENYDPAASYVLNYLKSKLAEYRRDDKVNEYRNMETFINDYVKSLYTFFKSLKDLLERTKNIEKYYKILSILGISATLYPLIVKLETLGILEKNLSGKEYSQYTFLDLLEIIDVRVYKIPKSDPRADISRFAYMINDELKEDKIQDWLLSYNKQWTSKERFLTYLNEDIYRNSALPHIFIEYCEEINGRKYSIDELINFVNKIPTIEHILSKTPKFTYKSVGFKNSEHFLEYENTLGNLTILEKSINSTIQNKLPFDKIPFYDKSLFKMTRELSSLIHRNKKFVMKNIEERTKYLVDKISARWWC